MARPTKTAKKALSAESASRRYLKGRIVGGTLSQMASYSDLFQRTTDPIFLIDPASTVILEHNPAAGAAFCDQIEVGKTTLGDLLTPDDRPNLLNRIGLEPIDLCFKGEKQSLRTMEVTSCRLKLSDYSEVVQVIAKDVSLLREMTRKLEILATTDELTGLNNVRSLRREIQREHERALRYNSPYSVLFCDVDNFKHYNDNNGHPAGDLVLQGIARILKGKLRAVDLAARYGGEEFVVLCPSVSQEGAETVAEVIRGAIESEQFPHAEKQPLGRVTVSIGVASFPADGQGIHEVLSAADHALYEAKRAGRNRVLSRAKKARAA